MTMTLFCHLEANIFFSKNSENSLLFAGMAVFKIPPPHPSICFSPHLCALAIPPLGFHKFLCFIWSVGRLVSWSRVCKKIEMDREIYSILRCLKGFIEKIRKRPLWKTDWLAEWMNERMCDVFRWLKHGVLVHLYSGLIFYPKTAKKIPLPC